MGFVTELNEELGRFKSGQMETMADMQTALDVKQAELRKSQIELDALQEKFAKCVLEVSIPFGLNF